MTAIEDLARRLERVEAELALHRLVHDYCVGADHRDLGRWTSVWTADAVWETSPDTVGSGQRAGRGEPPTWLTSPNAGALRRLAGSGDEFHRVDGRP